MKKKDWEIPELSNLLFKDKTDQEIADAIRSVKGSDNELNNVVKYQGERSICVTARKLQTLIKAVDPKAELTIKTKKGKWKV